MMLETFLHTDNVVGPLSFLIDYHYRDYFDGFLAA